MIETALLDLTAEDKPSELHRIIPLSRLIECLNLKKNALIYPSLWTDPFEAIELRTAFEYPLFKDSADGAIKVGMQFDGTPIRAGTMRFCSPADFKYFCQSWSAATESEIMWRAYSPDFDGVRITVNVDRLLEYAIQSLPNYTIYLGKVIYFPDEELRNLSKQGHENSKLQSGLIQEGQPWGISWARSLMKKREVYRHEEEHRIVAIHGKNFSETPKPTDTILLHDIEPNSLITHVQIDPRCTNYQNHVEAIQNAGFHGKISKSAILEPPNINIWESEHPREWKK